MAQSALECANSALIKLGEKTIDALSSASTAVRASQVCNQRIDIVKRNLLRKHPWNFAVKRYNLEPTWYAISGAADNGSGLIRISDTSHGLSSGDRVTIHDVGGTTEANGTWIITVINANAFDLVDSAFSTTYTSGGEWTLASKFNYDYSMALPSDCLRVLRVNDYMAEPDWRIEAGRVVTNSDLVELKYVYDVSDYTTMPVDFYECLALALATDVCMPLTQDKERKQMLYNELRQCLATARFADATEDPAEKLEANDWVSSRFTSPHTSRDYWSQS